MNVSALPVMFVAVLIPLTGYYIYLQNRRSAVNFLFFMICVSILFWMWGQAGVLCSTEAKQALWIYRVVVFFGVAIISPLIYHFSVIWLGLGGQTKKLIRFGYASAALFYGVGLFSPFSFPGVRHYNWGFYPIYGPVNYVFLLFFFSYFAMSFYNFARALKTEKNRQRLAQIQLITVAFLIAVLGSTDYIPKLVNFGLYPQGFLCVFAWIVIVAYAIIRYKAMDIETVIHKTLMWMATVSVALAPFIITVFWAHEYARSLPAITASFVFSGFMLAFYFYLQQVVPWLDDLFQRRRSNLRGQLEKFSSELVYLTDLRDLLQRFVRLLRRTLYVKELSVFLYDESAGHYAPVIAKRLRHLKPIPKGQVFLLWLEKEAYVAKLNKLKENPENDSMMTEIQALFEALHASVLMPFVVGSRLIGFAALGKRMNLRSYKHDEIQYLTQLTGPMSIALSNSRQFEKVQSMTEELQKWNRELENRVEKRTKELRETQEQLIQAEKMATLGILAGGVAHEINNPLTAVLTNSQILKMDAGPDEKESLDMIEEGAKRCQVIVQKLLNYSRSAAMEAPSQKTDLNRAVQNTIAMLGYQFKQDNVEILFESRDLPMIAAVQNEIEQVFTNLFVNAKDAIKRKNEPCGKIEVFSFVKGSKACVEVRDNGCGISKEIIGKIFDPFFTTKDVGEGTGLGLSVTHGIVKRYYGEVSVQSELGKGTVFTLSFPTSG